MVKVTKTEGQRGSRRRDSPPEGTIVIDVRVYLASVILAIAISFGAGVGLGPPPSLPDKFEHTPPVAESLNHLVTSHEPAAEERTPKNKKEEEERHRVPTGQHLLVDIKKVDSDFLNSEERLSQALINTVEESGLTLLSYHCHSLIPTGVSCVGVLLENHISFHTWPEDGVITLDLFISGSSPSFLSVISTIEKEFGIGENAKAQWSHQLRGFRTEAEKQKNYLDDSSDLSLWILSPMDFYRKEHVFSKNTKYQRVDIWDLVEFTDSPSYEDAIRHNLQPGDPRYKTPELVTPDRMLFLDGTIQSITQPEYHESIVHPAMFAHPGPKRVAIVGGGEGATLREVLKHKTLQNVTMIELDREMVEIAREYLPRMSNCSDLEGRADNCFDDELASVFYEDARDWFLSNFKKQVPEEQLFDVVLMDALDPEDNTEISSQLYEDHDFVVSLVNSLSDEGILAIQVGTAPNLHDPKPDIGVYSTREALLETLESIDGVEAILVYEEAHCGFLEPHSFLVACRSADCRSRWYAEPEAVDYQIYDRIVRTNSKKRALFHYDGATQFSYQIPPKAWETVYCRREPTPFECAYRNLDVSKELHDFNAENEEASSFIIEEEWIGEGEPDEDSEDGWEVQIFARVDIPKGSYIMPEHLSSSLVITDKSLQNLKLNTQVGGGRVAVIEDFLDFVDKHSHQSHSDGSQITIVEIGATYLIRTADDEAEANVGRWMPPHPSGRRPKFSPVYDRHRRSYDVFMVATKDIQAGTELKKYLKMWE